MVPIHVPSGTPFGTLDFIRPEFRFPEQLRTGVDSDHLVSSLSVQFMEMEFSSLSAVTKVGKLAPAHPLGQPAFCQQRRTA